MERILLAVDGIAPHYQLILRRDGALDELTVRCESAGAGAGGAGLAARAEHALWEETTITIRVELLGPGSVPRSAGKAVRVVDERSPRAHDPCGPTVARGKLNGLVGENGGSE